MSSVEIKTPTKRFPQPVDGYDRDTGEGVGHLFKFDTKGKLLADLPLGEGSIYHPGGIDYDGRYIWVPVAEYRPNSASIVYRVDPATMKATEVFRYGDHVGGIVHNTDDKHAARRELGLAPLLPLDARRQGRVDQRRRCRRRSCARPTRRGYIDYQDCKYLGRREMLCSRAQQLPDEEGRPALPARRLRDRRPAHRPPRRIQMPVELWTESGLPMTQNPFWVEATAGALRAYFMPEDEKSTLYIYERSADGNVSDSAAI